MAGVDAVSPKYVYGVLPEGAELPRGAGIGDASLQLIRHDGMAALVSDVADGDLRMGREEVSVHARVLEAAVPLTTVLPMRFGVVMESDAEVRARLLDAHRDELLAQLEDFAGKIELRVRAAYQEQPLMLEILREDHDVARLRGLLRGGADDATYYGRLKLGELVARAVERKRAVDSGAILDILVPLALAVDVAEPAHERIVLGASFLVEHDRIEEFDAAVEDVARGQADRMRFKYTGPLPPHSFVHLAGGA